MRQAFRDYLLADSSISAKVSSRCYPVKLPQGVTYPALSFQTVSLDTEPSLSGPSRIQRTRMQIDVWAKTYSEAVGIADLVRSRLDGVNATQDSTQIASSWLGAETDLYEDEVEVYRITADYDIAFWSI